VIVPKAIQSLNLTTTRPEWERFHQRTMQVKAFTRWVNYYLKKKGLQIEDISKDFGNGEMLANLVEILSGQSLNINTMPTNNVHKIQNINWICKFLRDGRDFPIIPAEGIVNGNIKNTLDLLWALIFIFNIAPISFQGKKAGDAILLWLQTKISSYGLTVTDFSSGFEDGEILCALIDSFDPSLGFAQMMKYKRRENINHALDSAEETWGVPKLFDAEDLSSDLDELSIITYLAHCFELCTYT